jgi:lysozyme family protein
MASFENIVQWLLYQEDSKHTPGLIVNLGDGAGLTRLGITQKNFGAMVPANFFTDMEFHGAVAIAKYIYRNQFWNKFMGDLINSDLIAAPLLSFSVNKSVSTAVRMLQQVLDISPDDGLLGLQTLNELNSKDGAITAKLFRAAWDGYYHRIAAQNPGDVRFISGWDNRVNFPYPSILVPTGLYA